ncbi:hypothetical protein PROSTU_04642 [Providencia stuartii ATCC 25827]|uniref:Uncharacterized protein n=1 Tax=Providencia stuartii ATCC 25827 TaxID=471874 RepID=A0AA86YV60_PROST|nr:hypothetical protein PROSTU_04642 [Providencia stuartii ATCC 25827]
MLPNVIIKNNNLYLIDFNKKTIKLTQPKNLNLTVNFFFYDFPFTAL